MASRTKGRRPVERSPGGRSGLHRRRPEHQRQERLVDVRARGVEQQRERRAGERRGQPRRPLAEDGAAEREDPCHERDVGENRDEDEKAVGVLAHQAEQRADEQEQRMLRRRGVGIESRRLTVEQLAAPDQVVVGVVVGIGRDERPGQDAREQQPAQRQHRETRSAHSLRRGERQAPARQGSPRSADPPGTRRSSSCARAARRTPRPVPTERARRALA